MCFFGVKILISLSLSLSIFFFLSNSSKEFFPDNLLAPAPKFESGRLPDFYDLIDFKDILGLMVAFLGDLELFKKN